MKHMRNRSEDRQHYCDGEFTHSELLIASSIVEILSAVALSNYTRGINKTKQSEVISKLLALQKQT